VAIGNSNNNPLNRPPSVNVQMEANSPEPVQLNNPTSNPMPSNASNESSNLSCGGSCSDKEMDAIQSNAKIISTPILVEKKQPTRKRKLKVTTHQDTPRPEKAVRKITEMFKVCSVKFIIVGGHGLPYFT
jgi:hypothetical protein